MGFKYNEDIFNAIANALLKVAAQDKSRRELNFNKLHMNSIEVMRVIPQYGADYKSSPNYFNMHLKKMVNDGDVARREQMSSRFRIDPVYYSLTEKGEKRHRLKMQHEAIGVRDKAYQLLLLYCTFKDVPVLPIDHGRNVLENEEELDRFLSEISLHRKDFEVERVDFNSDQYRVIKMVEPKQKVRILRIEYLQGSKGLEGRFEYRYILPGISIRQFLRGVNSGRALEHIRESMSQSEAEECFELLLKEDLITIVMRYRGEPRYDIANEDLREVLKSCWLLCGVAEMAMNFIWKNARLPTAEEREWLNILRGKQAAMIRLNSCYEKLKTREKDKKKKGYHKIASEVESSIRALYGGITAYFEEIHRKYALVGKEFTPPLDILTKMVYPEFLRNLVAKKEI